MQFTSDFIIGYPGETQYDFEQTIKLMKKVKFVNSYSFIYSARPGTPAFDLNPIDENNAKERLITFQKISKKIKTQYRETLLTKTIPILFENETKDRKKYFGRDEHFNSVIVESNENLTGKIKNIKITKINQNTLFGEISSKLNQKDLQLNYMSEISKLEQNIIVKKIDNETTNIQVTNNEMLISVVGQFDQNLKDLSKLTDTSSIF